MSVELGGHPTEDGWVLRMVNRALDRVPEWEPKTRIAKTDETAKKAARTPTSYRAPEKGVVSVEKKNLCK